MMANTLNRGSGAKRRSPHLRPRTRDQLGHRHALDRGRASDRKPVRGVGTCGTQDRRPGYVAVVERRLDRVRRRLGDCDHRLVRLRASRPTSGAASLRLADCVEVRRPAVNRFQQSVFGEHQKPGDHDCRPVSTSMRHATGVASLIVAGGRGQFRTARRCGLENPENQDEDDDDQENTATYIHLMDPSTSGLPPTAHGVGSSRNLPEACRATNVQPSHTLTDSAAWRHQCPRWQRPKESVSAPEAM